MVLIQGLLGGFGQDVGGVCHYLKEQLGLKDLFPGSLMFY